jgi:hypothetical protein
MEAAGTSEHWYLSTKLHGVPLQKAMIVIVTTKIVSNLVTGLISDTSNKECNENKYQHCTQHITSFVLK